jgi:hypothetical protein
MGVEVALTDVLSVLWVYSPGRRKKKNAIQIMSAMACVAS